MGSGLFSSSWRGSERGASLKRCWAHYIIMNCDIDDVLTFNFRGQILQWFHIRIGWTDGYETKAVWIVRMDDTYLVWHCSDVLMNAMASQITGVLIVSSTVCSGADQRKHKAPFPWPLWGESPQKGPVTRKMFPVDDVVKALSMTFNWDFTG